MLRQLVSFDLLINAVRARTHRVTMAKIHPLDKHRIPLDMVSNFLGNVPIIEDASVTRGELFVETVPTRR